LGATSVADSASLSLTSLTAKNLYHEVRDKAPSAKDLYREARDKVPRVLTTSLFKPRLKEKLCTTKLSSPPKAELK